VQAKDPAAQPGQAPPCPIGRAADVLGDRWTLLILRNATVGMTRFEDFKSDLGIANNEVPHFAHADEQLLYTLTTQILRDQFVDTETFDAALAEWGEAGLADIIGCLGNFAMLAMLLNTFQVDLKTGDPEPFPHVRGFVRVSTQGTESPGTRSG
jgi:hypothetical protein